MTTYFLVLWRGHRGSQAFQASCDQAKEEVLSQWRAIRLRLGRWGQHWHETAVWTIHWQTGNPRPWRGGSRACQATTPGGPAWWSPGRVGRTRASQRALLRDPLHWTGQVASGKESGSCHRLPVQGVCCQQRWIVHVVGSNGGINSACSSIGSDWHPCQRFLRDIPLPWVGKTTVQRGPHHPLQRWHWIVRAANTGTRHPLWCARP